MQRFKHLLLFTTILIFSYSKAVANESFISVAVGNTSPENSNFEDDTGFKLTGGFEFFENFFFQASYIDLGDFKLDSKRIAEFNRTISFFNLTSFGLNFSDTVTVTDVSVEITGIELAVEAKTPLSEVFDLFVSLGVFIWDGDTTTSVTINRFGGDSFSEKSTVNDDGSDASISFGGRVKVAENYSVQLAWSRYDALDADTDLLSLGLRASF